MTEREKTHTCGLIKRAFERAFGCRKNAIEAYDKRTNVAFARHAAMSAAMEIIGETVGAMAARFNRTQHTRPPRCSYCTGGNRAGLSGEGQQSLEPVACGWN